MLLLFLLHALSALIDWLIFKGEQMCNCLEQIRILRKFLEIYYRRHLSASVNHLTLLIETLYCVCIKFITLFNYMCCASCDSASVIWNIGECGTKNYFTDQRTANTRHCLRDSFAVLKILRCS